ncbi:hypothetical protein DH2020_035851 [Rehmannia glutinosa]|uniref:Tubby-like F-box protein n=1 Tax=Rehmannia glutinosa TaxID=99300 RepID=A0ABR0V7Y6_REHGL
MIKLGLKSRSRRVVQDSSMAVEKSKNIMGKNKSDVGDNCSYCCWANLPSELLREVLLKVEESESKWPARKHVVACAGVCKSWREVMKEVVKTPEVSGKITFLYPLSRSALADDGKFLLAARKCRRPTCTDYIISLQADDMSKGNDTYIGKLRGPRRMHCVMDAIKASSIKPGGVAPTQTYLPITCVDSSPTIPFFRTKSNYLDKSLSGPLSNQGDNSSLVLRNKSPRWHEQLQCWCLNFHGRVTVASVKNFQLVASPENGVAGPEHDKVILQFGKVGKDVFTMDYRYPISAFQAFAICLSSFDTKIACE